MVIQFSYLTSQNFLKSTNKIPEYARDHKKEYLFIIGLDKELRRFYDYHLSKDDDDILIFHKRIENLIKRFIRFQERGYLTFKCCDVLNIYRLNKESLFEILVYFDNFEKYKDFYNVFCKFYNKLKFDGDESNIVFNYNLSLLRLII